MDKADLFCLAGVGNSTGLTAGDFGLAEAHMEINQLKKEAQVSHTEINQLKKQVQVLTE